jgi:hypothetical protein
VTQEFQISPRQIALRRERLAETIRRTAEGRRSKNGRRALRNIICEMAVAVVRQVENLD